ncbi:MAG: SulP family inorganic anion transporter [Opitutaceae bacterium]|jgi:high affinity sulfate transporter 1|nr:SulP family inorganic anion transporter [Opitutaceae bacterium]
MPAEKLINRFMPGLAALRHYRKDWLPGDLSAGLSVAAVQVPVAIAYAQLIGLPAEAGLHSCILPMLLYALVGGSGRLQVGPEAATCLMAGAVLAPLAAADPGQKAALCAMLTLMVGACSILAGVLRLGFVASFLSRPILLGFLNGIGLSLIAGQLTKILGCAAPRSGALGAFWETLGRPGGIHWPTLATGLLALALIAGLRRLRPRWPAPLLAIAAAALAAFLFHLDRQGVALTGRIEARLSLPRLPPAGADPASLARLLQGAASITVVAFCSGMLAARGFAGKNDRALNPNHEFAAFGVADIGSALCQGFPVGGAASRTAVNALAGGRSHLAGAVAALAVAGVLLCLARPLSWVPAPALGAVLVVAGAGVLDLRALRLVRRASRFEFWLSIATTAGVLTVGVLPGIIFAIALTLLRTLQLLYRPADVVLGWKRGVDAQVDARLHPDARTVPGVVVYRFDAPLLFFNADYFKERVLKLVEEQKAPAAVLFVAEMVGQTDVTGLETLRELCATLRARGVTLALARPHKGFRTALEQSGVLNEIGPRNLFTSVRTGMQHFRQLRKQAAAKALAAARETRARETAARAAAAENR